MSSNSAVAGLLSGKRGLIIGVANQNSIAWACAAALAGAGMELAFTYQGEVMRDRVMKTTAEMGEVPLFDLDVTDDGQIDAVHGQVERLWGGRLDFLLHSVAYAPSTAMGAPFIETQSLWALLTAQGGLTLLALGISDRLPRFEDWVCPGVLGIKPDDAAYIIQRVRHNAERFHLRVDKDQGNVSRT